MGFYVIGAGGHAKVVLSTLQAAGIKADGIFDDSPEKQGLELFGVRVIGSLDAARAMKPQVGIIAIGDNKSRHRIAEEFAGWEWPCIVHPNSYVHHSVSLGPGTVVFAGCVVQPDTRIGSHVIINTGATVDHDCVIHNFVHLAPGTHLAGYVVVEEGVLMGVGSVAIPGVRIGAWSVVGAGGVVIKDLPSFVVAVGVPAKPISGRNDFE